MACRTNRTGRSPAGLSPGTRTPLKHDGDTYSPDLICKECGGAVSRMHAQAFRAPPLHLTYASSPARASASNGRWSERAREGRHAHRHRQWPLFCEVLVYGFRHTAGADEPRAIMERMVQLGRSPVIPCSSWLQDILLIQASVLLAPFDAVKSVCVLVSGSGHSPQLTSVRPLLSVIAFFARSTRF